VNDPAALGMNRAAFDDNVLLLVQLAALPLASPPIPYLRPAAPPTAAMS
jgi:hypothetical protein